jgi:hypothetical protein
MEDEDDAYPKPGEIKRLDESSAFQQTQTRRANVPKLSAHPALQQNYNDDDPVQPEQLGNLAQRPEFQHKSDDDDLYPDVERIKKLMDNPRFQQEEPDIAKEHVTFLDNAIKLAAPPDLFGNQQNANAWFNLQSSASRDKLAEIQFWVIDNQDHAFKIEISSKHKKVMTLIKDRYNDDDVFKEFQRDIHRRVKWLIEKATRPQYTTKTIPDDRWFANSSKDNATLSYAVSNFRNIDLSCTRLKINVLYIKQFWI